MRSMQKKLSKTFHACPKCNMAVCHAMFQDLPFKIHVLTPTHIGRGASHAW